ncbi:peptide/nickel transport system ATP-binding protein [Pseudonocardia thermophila]|jgi:oligopeptide/dipeptide ABC transporter, ATP-binding protein, C-terminal domain|uniref:Peptide/nickel transport system ATP-binding protein n=1 Tax=Pseudonocardia thermophila TaxID=1848 RepID=A0A1M6T1X3_PSETH|nr:ABC transporter ATP-binding protein [Pseudonocardia thermophila]SHK50909.1 peptide/nickel transport system ATP-binding protein [Pseudonocardia thermophila]
MSLAPPPSREPLLAVSDLAIDLAGETVQRGLIHDVSFTVAPGESVALIGESGCGKTMTGMAVLGLLPRGFTVSSGSIRLGGRDLLACSERELRSVRGRSLGAIFQEPMSSLDPTMRVGDQIAEARRLHLGESRKVARARAEELLDRVGIADAARRLDSYPHELSGGMQQRVMIASAIACDPDLVLADEPTTALDVTIQAEILELLRELRREQGIAVLLVTHDLGVVADFCDRVVVMYAGTVVERAGVDELFADPAHPYTRALLDAVPQTGHPRTLLPVIQGRVPVAGRFPAGCRFEPRCPHGGDERCLAPQHETALPGARSVRCARAAAGEPVTRPAVPA